MGVTISEPRKPLKFFIKKKHVECAVRGKPCECVIAQAFMDQHGNDLLNIEVRATVTTLIWAGARVERYATSELLREALRRFDNTGQWNLSEGEYELLPLPKSQTKKAVRTRARMRQQNREPAKLKHYTFNGSGRARPINPRGMNMKMLRDQVKANRTTKKVA